MNGNYSKTYQGCNLIEENTAAISRPMMIQNLTSNDTYRSSILCYNPGDYSITVEYSLINECGVVIGSEFSKTIARKEFQSFNPFVEAGIPYPDYLYDNIYIIITPTSSNGEVLTYGATANNYTNDPATHIAVRK